MEYQQLMHAQRYDGTTTLQKTAAHAIHNGEEYLMKKNSYLSSNRFSSHVHVTATYASFEFPKKAF